MIFMWRSTLDKISQKLKDFYCAMTISPAQYNHNMFYQVLIVVFYNFYVFFVLLLLYFYVLCVLLLLHVNVLLK